MTQKSSDLDDYKEYLDYKLKLSKIDSLLIFCSSSMFFVFSVLQSIIGGFLSLIYFFPVACLSVVLPIHIEYLRGAIIIDSPLERIRGGFIFSQDSSFTLHLFYDNILSRFQGSRGY